MLGRNVGVTDRKEPDMIVTDLSNKEKRKEYNRKWYLNNEENIKQYRLDHKEHIKKRSKQYYLKNKEHIKEYSKKWHLDNREYLIENGKQYRLNNEKEIKESRDNIRNTEEGYLKMRYSAMKDRARKEGRECCTRKEFFGAWKKQNSKYGMKSPWGLGNVENGFEGHETMTMNYLGKSGSRKGSTRIPTNVSVDRIDPKLGYTVKNIQFITNKENTMKNKSSYKDCLIQIKLTDERFK